jgi:predicted anti-sigma-YlaC factor YlaD
MTCEEIRELLHDAHDGERQNGLPEPALAHLAACGACRELQDDLTTLSAGLRAMPRHPLPPDALDAVWRQTIRAKSPGFGASTRPWRLAAAAVLVTAIGTTTLYFMYAPATPPRPSAVELARASAQAEMVFGYTARALAATRTATTDRVLASKVSPAVRGVGAAHPSRRP